MNFFKKLLPAKAIEKNDNESQFVNNGVILEEKIKTLIAEKKAREEQQLSQLLKQAKENWLWANPQQSSSSDEEDELFFSTKGKMKSFYEKNNDDHTPTDGSILRAEDKKTDDKTDVFIAVLSERRVWCYPFTPLISSSPEFDSGEAKLKPTQAVIGVTIGPIYFRKNFNSVKSWIKTFKTINKLDLVEVSSFSDAPFPSNMASCLINCYDPIVVQQIDMLLEDCKNVEIEEYMNKLENGTEIKPNFSNNPFND